MWSFSSCRSLFVGLAPWLHGVFFVALGTTLGQHTLLRGTNPLRARTALNSQNDSQVTWETPLLDEDDDEDPRVDEDHRVPDSSSSEQLPPNRSDTAGGVVWSEHQSRTHLLHQSRTHLMEDPVYWQPGVRWNWQPGGDGEWIPDRREQEWW